MLQSFFNANGVHQVMTSGGRGGGNVGKYLKINKNLYCIKILQ